MRIMITARWKMDFEQLYRLDVNFSKFSNRQDYILDCMRRVVKFCFGKGFAVNGVQVRLENM